MASKRADLKLLNPQKIKMSKPKAFAILTLGAFIGAFSSFFFVIAANLYSPGLSGISSGISYTINDILWSTGNTWGQSRASADAMIYWVVYGLCNIPIIYLTTRWFSNRFLYYSVYYFIVNFIFSMLFANIPGISHGLIDITSLEDQDLRAIVILFFSFVGGVASGVAVGLAFKVGACTMGLDPVAKHISRERNINIGPVLSTIGAITTTVFVVGRGFIPQAQIVDGDFIGTLPSNVEALGFLPATLFSPEYVGSWLFIISYSVVADSVYSSAKKVELLATTDKTDEISNYLNASAYHRGHTIVKMEGGYSHQEKKGVLMIINYDEMYDIVEKIAAMDHKAFITVKEIARLYDIHNWTTITEEDKEKERKRIIKKEKKKFKLEAKSSKKGK